VPEPQIKGLTFRSFIGAARRLYGPAVVEKMLPYLPADVAAAIGKDRFITSGWYPLSQYRALHAALARATGGDPPALARAIGRDATMDDFRGIYRVLAFVLAPEFLMRRAPGIWSRYYDTGTLEVPAARRGYAEARFRGCAGFDRVLWEDAIGGCLGTLEVCGAKEPSAEVLSGGGDGDDFLDGIVRWR
jgi:hypothetical protein